MRKLLLALLLVGTLFSCENACDVQTDIDQIKAKRTALTNQQYDLLSTINGLRNTSDQLTKDLEYTRKVKGIINTGREPRYVVTLHLEQSRFSIDPFEHAKDAMNAIEFDIPVDKKLFDEVKVGTTLVKEFRSGSFIMSGTFSDWDITIESKKIL
tara:strand:+ start:5104 stop:5568 length:465 start_codon:yes stop_codon:yes gene_type:complete